jgi:hypothetical protein
MILFPIVSYSQALDSPPPVVEKPDYKGYLGLNFGFSIPNGSFAATDDKDGQTGYAINGQSLQLLDVGYRFYQNLNASLHYIRLRNGFDENTLADNLRTPGFRYSVEASNYELNAAFLGIGFVKPTNSISLQMQIMIGYGNIFVPSIDILETNDMGEVREIRFSSSKESGVGFGVSGGFRIHLTERLDLSTHATFINFQQEYDQVSSSNGQSSIQSSKLNYEVISVTFGLAYRILP